MIGHRHVLEVCSCGTVLYDCGCRLRLLEVRDAACHGCRFAREDLIERQREICALAYAAQVWEEAD